MTISYIYTILLFYNSLLSSTLTVVKRSLSNVFGAGYGASLHFEKRAVAFSLFLFVSKSNSGNFTHFLK